MEQLALDFGHADGIPIANMQAQLSRSSGGTWTLRLLEPGGKQFYMTTGSTPLDAGRQANTYLAQYGTARVIALAPNDCEIIPDFDQPV